MAFHVFAFLLVVCLLLLALLWRLDWFPLRPSSNGGAMLAIPDKRMDVSIGDSKVRTLLFRTGEAIGVYPLRCAPSAFHLTPGTYRCRGRSHTGGTTTDRTIKRGARLEQTVQLAASAACW
jgi:hypothetical protein